MNKFQTAIRKSESVNVAPNTIPNFISASTTLNMDIAVYPYDASAAASRMTNLLNDAMSGKALHRSKDLNELASKASALRGRKPASAKRWASKMAKSVTNL